MAKKKQKGRNKLDDKTILQILDYWFEDIYENYLKIPPRLKHKVTEDDITRLSFLTKSGVEGRNTIYASDYIELRNNILQRIKIKTELENIKKTEEAISDQISIGKKQNYFIGLSVLIAAISLTFAIFVGYNDFELKEKQEGLIEKQIASISPLKAEIEVSLDHPEDKKILISSIALIRDQGGDEYAAKQKIRFILSNIGRMRTGPINANLASSFTNEPHEYIQDIVGESSEYLELSVGYKECWRDIKYEMLENGTEIVKHVVDPKCNFETADIPLGWQEFNLTIDCKFCSEPIKTQTFYFCIFDDTDASREVCEKESNNS